MNNFTKAAASLTASALFSLAFTACSDSTSANDEIFANISLKRAIPRNPLHRNNKFRSLLRATPSNRAVSNHPLHKFQNPLRAKASRRPAIPSLMPVTARHTSSPISVDKSGWPKT